MMMSLLCLKEKKRSKNSEEIFFVKSEPTLKLFPAHNSTIVCNCTATAEEKPSKILKNRVITYITGC